LQDTLILAIRIGLKIEEYWDLTPSEFCCYLKAFEHKELDLLNKNITLSWYTEYFARQKKLDKVTKYLIKDTKNNKKTTKNNKKITKNNKKMSEEEIEKHYKSKAVK
jgi:hypothetical protein